ncbi:MAG: asparagine synthase (glutamine-hydrolyzing), partial [Myxococcota bacterium]|nr:asparagine synthase (glutamine-hydrolyzing) [Myxococcota bacterium]
MATSGGILRYPDVVEAMGGALRHRGPDASRKYATETAVFGAERLRIIDPSTNGDQPFIDPSEKIWLVLNGTVYNAPALRSRYREYPFRSTSDAETVIPLFLDKGKKGLSDIEGMFALAIYDARNDELLLARDRAGEKPLFYHQCDNEVWFASEIQALLLHPALTRSLDVASIRDYTAFGSVAEPRTMWSAIRRVRSGSVMSFSPTGQREHRYWQPTAAPVKNIQSDEAERTLESLLKTSVRSQMYSDVPLGVFVSGGLDSSLIAAMAKQYTGSKTMQTFSIGFDSAQFDERPYSKMLASYLKADYVEVVATRDRLSEALGVIVDRVAEPIADPAILPTYLLAQKAREHVKVVLSGEG